MGIVISLKHNTYLKSLVNFFCILEKVFVIQTMYILSSILGIQAVIIPKL